MPRPLSFAVLLSGACCAALALLTREPAASAAQRAAASAAPSLGAVSAREGGFVPPAAALPPAARERATEPTVAPPEEPAAPVATTKPAALARLLRDPTAAASERKAAAERLAALGTAAAAAALLEALGELSGDPLLGDLAGALATVREVPAIPVLERGLDAQPEVIHAAAAAGLCSIGTRRAFHALLRHAAANQARRDADLRALAELPRHADAVGLLAAAEPIADPAVAGAAARAAAARGTEEVADLLLLRIDRTPAGPLRDALLAAVAELGPGSSQLALLRTAAAHPDRALRSAAIAALRRTGGEKAAALLAQLAAGGAHSG